MFVLDSMEEDYGEAVDLLRDTLSLAARHGASPAVEVLVHKVDAENFPTAEARADRVAEARSACESALAGLPHGVPKLRYHESSVYDHTIYESASRCMQQLVLSEDALSRLLSEFVECCSAYGAVLYDVLNKLQIGASWNRSEAPQDVELFGEVLDAVVDVSCIYSAPVARTENSGAPRDHMELSGRDGDQAIAIQQPAAADSTQQRQSSQRGDQASAPDSAPASASLEASPMAGGRMSWDDSGMPLSPDMAGMASPDHDGRISPAGDSGSEGRMSPARMDSGEDSDYDEDGDVQYDVRAVEAFDAGSAAVVRLGQDRLGRERVLHMYYVSKYTALVTLVPAEVSEQLPLLEHNVTTLRTAMQRILEVHAASGDGTAAFKAPPSLSMAGSLQMQHI